MERAVSKPSQLKKALLVTDEAAMIERIAAKRRKGQEDHFITDKTTEKKIQAEIRRQNRKQKAAMLPPKPAAKASAPARKKPATYERYYAKEVNGKGYLFDREFSTKVPCATETTFAVAQKQADKFNAEEAAERAVAATVAKKRPAKKPAVRAKTGKKPATKSTAGKSAICKR